MWRSSRCGGFRRLLIMRLVSARVGIVLGTRSRCWFSGLLAVWGLVWLAFSRVLVIIYYWWDSELLSG